MMGKKLKSPNKLMRRAAVGEAGELMEYHETLLKQLQRSSECAERPRVKE
ncbi:hypothetical protein PF005_g8013 [Phytophthora fragariae]|uniref:Uncharacterized protein n=1 Tax=Phytophthora fragariae TaxID=53985 RepID=A0A6A3LDT2_9STRA|nr:hypothetical protein PF003_g20432 [Phytophthora fragariae]KAE8944687.1 hypothetical protein PF009_g5644 [Phytophthora fragariae]KAE9016780.1 hypothetical protein PF011_g7002 [Phytophthora fragariae]KAE9117304.1 hypothetical protein PF007_g9336 [Phytophthora fragariae]KAE9128690.1 hypothetical protein PF010_g4417 [Phytophthora fragariae]